MLKELYKLYFKIKTNLHFGFSEDIFRKAGSSLSPEVSTILVGVALLAVALPVPYLIEKLGRRPLQLVSTFGMTICTVRLKVLKEQ